MREFLDKTFYGNTVEDYLLFAGIAIGIVILSRWISRLLSFVFSKLLGRLAKGKAKLFWDLTRKPLSLFIILFTIYLSFSLLAYPSELDFQIHGLLFSKLLLLLYQAVLAIVFTWFLFNVANFLAEVFKERALGTESTADDQLVLFGKDIVKVILVIVAGFFILGSVFGLNITSLMAGAGIVGLAIAFAAQESIANFFGSLTIFADKPFTIGDLIRVGNVEGTVEKVGFRSTRIRTLDKTFVTVPNRVLNTENTENRSLRTFRRVRMTVGLTYGTSSEAIRNVVKDIQDYIDGHELTNQDGIVSFYEFGDSSLNVMVNYYVQNIEWHTYLKTREQINFRISEIVQQHGSDFAFPSRTVYLQQEG